MTNKPFNLQTDQHITPLSRFIDDLDKEQTAQRQEFLKRERELKHSLPLQRKRYHQPVKQKSKPKVLTFEEKLEITYQWLEERFSHLFPDKGYIPLDIFIL